jgi:hypothetical protein
MARQTGRKLKVVAVTFAPDGDGRARQAIANAIRILLSNGRSGGDADDHGVHLDDKGAKNEGKPP